LDQHYALVYKCLQNDRKAQAELYELFAGKMFAVCMRYASDYDTASDILQDGFVKVFNALSKFGFDGSVEGWIRRIMVNTAIDYFRKASKLHMLVGMEEVEVVDSDSTHFLSQLAVDDILALIQKLPPGYRTVLNMYVLEDYSHKEIAQMLEISEGTSKSQLARAKALLASQLQKKGLSYGSAK
jgi:RNA polymerase sigma-70 factor (ECF subfamily)